MLDEKLYAIKYIMYHIYTINFIIQPDFRYIHSNVKKKSHENWYVVKKGEQKTTTN